MLSSSLQNPPQLLKSVKTELNTCPLKDFHLGRMNIFIVMLKNANNAGHEGRVASSVLSFVFHHTVVCEFMTALIKHNSLIPSALIHPYTRALLPLNVTVGTKHFSLYSSSINNRTFWMLLDLKWLTWSLRPEYGFQKSLFCRYGPWRG